MTPGAFPDDQRIALDDVETIVLEGADAMAFAQAQFAADLATLAVGHWQWSCWLNAQGRVIVLFLLARPAEQRLNLVLPGCRADEIATRLRRYVFRAKLGIARSTQRASGTFGGRSDQAPARHGVLVDDGASIMLELAGSRQRLLHLGDQAAISDGAGRESWRAADIDDGIPWIEGAGVERWIPQSLALERLSAFSVRKGCYPGQEIVARTHFLGRNKRALWRGRFAPGSPRPGSGARLLAAGAASDAEAAAEVVIDCASAGRTTLLAVAREDCPTTLRSAADGSMVELSAPVRSDASG